MPAFSAWHRQAAGHRAWHRFVYAAGAPAMVLEVEQYLRGSARWGSGRTKGMIDAISDVRTYQARDGFGWPELSAFLEGPDFDGPRRMAVIRDAHLVDESVWPRFLQWFHRSDVQIRDRTHILATSSERWLPDDPADSRHGVFGNPPRVRGYPYGVYVDCKGLSVPQQVRFVEQKFTLRGVPAGDAKWAELLVERCAGDFLRLRSEIDKVFFFIGAHGKVDSRTVEAVVSPSPGEQFVEALLAGQMADACERAYYVSSLRFVLGSLDWHLQALYLIRQALTGSRGRAVTEVARLTGYDPYTVLRLRRQARTYDLATVRRRYSALLTASRLMARTDRPERVLLPLVALW